MSSSRAIVKNFYAIGDSTAEINPAKVSGDMSASITGPTTILDKVDQVCFQIRWTSSNAVGTIAIQGSVDNENFEDITFSPPLTQPDSDNGSYLVNMALIPFMYIRVQYTRVSGTGNLYVNMSCKGV